MEIQKIWKDEILKKSPQALSNAIDQNASWVNIHPIIPWKALFFKMAARIKNSEWEEDIVLENNLKEQVSRNLGQSELVDFISQISNILLESEHSILSSPSFWDQVHWLLCW